MTPDQVELLVWVVESAPHGAVLFFETAPLADTGMTEATVAVPGGPKRDVNPADVRELVELELLRQVDQHRHEVTTAGRTAHRALTMPPVERPPVGFQRPI